MNRYHYKDGPLSNPSSGSENSRSRKYDPRGVTCSTSSSSFLPRSEAVPCKDGEKPFLRELLKTNEPCDWIDNLWGTPWGIKYNGLIHVTDARSDPAVPVSKPTTIHIAVVKPQWCLAKTLPLRFPQQSIRFLVLCALSSSKI